MTTLAISIFHITFANGGYKVCRRMTQRIWMSDGTVTLRRKLNNLFAIGHEDMGRVWIRTADHECTYKETLPTHRKAKTHQASQPDANTYTMHNAVNCCASRRLGYSRQETIWSISNGNVSSGTVAHQRAIEACMMARVSSRDITIRTCWWRSVRSGVAGAVALGSAYAMSMPQKANADIIYQADIASHADVRPDLNGSGIPTVYYNSPQVNFRDTNGNLIDGGLTNRVVLLYIRDFGENNGTDPIGGLTLEANNSSASGWLGSYVDLGEGYFYNGMQAGETAVNGLNGGSYWAGGIDLDGDGNVGTYTLNDNGTWTLNFDLDEGMFHSGDPNLLPGQYSFALNGVPQHPGSGNGPVTIDSIDIYAPYTVPEPSTLISVGIGAAMGDWPSLTISNSSPATTITVQRAEDLMSTNWLSLTNFATGFTNWIDLSATGEWRSLFYRAAHE